MQGQAINVLGIVSTVTERARRDGQRFLIVALELLGGIIEVTVWPEALQRTEELWQAGRTVRVAGKVRVRADQLELTCDDAEEYVPARPSMLTANANGRPAPAKTNGNGNGNGRNGDPRSQSYAGGNGNGNGARLRPPGQWKRERAWKWQRPQRRGRRQWAPSVPCLQQPAGAVDCLRVRRPARRHLQAPGGHRRDAGIPGPRPGEPGNQKPGPPGC